MKIQRIKRIFHFDASYIIYIEQRVFCLKVLLEFFSFTFNQKPTNLNYLH